MTLLAKRVDGQTGILGVGGLSSATGAGGTFDLGANWTGPTIQAPLSVEFLIDPPILGLVNANFEALTATVVNGSSTATVVKRAIAGTQATHAGSAALWATGPFSASYSGLAIDLSAAPYNVIADGKSISDGNITTGTAILTATSSAPFAVTDVGKSIAVARAGGNPAGELRTTILSYQSASQVTLNANATKTVASRTVADAVTTAGSATLTSATAAFVSNDVGAPVTGANIPTGTTIQAYTNGTTVTLSQNAMASGTGGALTLYVGVQYGTDNITAINNALADLAPYGGTLLAPLGKIICTSSLRCGIAATVTKTTIIVQGCGMYASSIVFINSNSNLILQPAGTNPTTQIPQMVFRDLTFDQLYRCDGGTALDGVMSRQAGGFIWGLPYPFNNTSAVPYPGTAALGWTTRVDTNCTTTSGSASVTDASVLATDVGATVVGAGIPIGTVITAVSGTTITLSANATASSSTVTLTIGLHARNDASCGTTNTSTTVTDTHIVASDLGSVVTGAGIPANTIITSVTAGTSFVMSNAATATATVTLAIQNYARSSATSTTSLTDSNAVWTLNQWVGYRVVIDEDKAAKLTASGAGYATIIGNSATTLMVAGWEGTKSTTGYTPSGQTVRYRIQVDVFQGVHHRCDNVRFYRPTGFATQATRGDFSNCTLQGCGQPDWTTHNDNFGSSGTHAIANNVKRVNCAGSFGDFTGSAPGLWATFISDSAENFSPIGTSGVYCAGVGGRISRMFLENPTLGGGVGYDATTHPANMGRNVVTTNLLAQENIYGSGLNALYADVVANNVASDAPLTQPGGTFGSITFVSGTGQQVSANRETFVVVPITLNPTAGAAATCLVELTADPTSVSPVWTALGTITTPAGVTLDNTVEFVQQRVPAGGGLRLTVTNAVIGTGIICV